MRSGAAAASAVAAPPIHCRECCRWAANERTGTSSCGKYYNQRVCFSLIQSSSLAECQACTEDQKRSGLAVSYRKLVGRESHQEVDRF